LKVLAKLGMLCTVTLAQQQLYAGTPGPPRGALVVVLVGSGIEAQYSRYLSLKRVDYYIVLIRHFTKILVTAISNALTDTRARRQDYSCCSF
jgi:hypothetical protein